MEALKGHVKFLKKVLYLLIRTYVSPNRMAWQWAETLVEIRVTLADIRGTTK